MDKRKSEEQIKKEIRNKNLEDYVNLNNAYNRLRADVDSYKRNMESARNETREVQKKYNELLMENETLRKLVDEYMGLVQKYQTILRKQDKNIDKLIKCNDDLIEVNKMLMEQTEDSDKCKCNCYDDEALYYQNLIEFATDMILQL